MDHARSWSSVMYSYCRIMYSIQVCSLLTFFLLKVVLNFTPAGLNSVTWTVSSVVECCLFARMLSVIVAFEFSPLFTSCWLSCFVDSTLFSDALLQATQHPTNTLRRAHNKDQYWFYFLRRHASSWNVVWCNWSPQRNVASIFMQGSICRLHAAPSVDASWNLTMAMHPWRIVAT